MSEQDEFNRWMTLVNQAQDYFYLNQESIVAEFKLDQHERYDWNQNDCELIFSSGGIHAVVAKIQIIGSVAYDSGTWLWSWANPSINEAAKEKIETVKKYGMDNDVASLTNEEFNADDSDGWLMAAIAAYITKAKGVYISPFEGGVTFLLITEISYA